MKKIIERYDDVAAKYNEEYCLKEESDIVKEFLHFLKKGDRVLDVACGPGNITNFFARRGVKIEGVDLSSGMLAIARKNHPKIKFRKMDMRKLNYADKSFDALLCSYALYHLTKKQALTALKEFNRVLKPGGTLMLIVQEGSGEGMVADTLKPGTKIFINRMSEAELKRLFKKIGFEFVKSLKRKPMKGEFPYNKLGVIARKPAAGSHC